MSEWTFWEAAYHGGDRVDVQIGGAWQPGGVSAGWTPSPALGVLVDLDAGGPAITVGSADGIRHRGAEAIAPSGTRMLLTANIEDVSHSWPVTISQRFDNGLALVMLDGVSGRPIIAKAEMLTPL